MQVGILVNEIERESIENLFSESILYKSLRERGADVSVVDITTDSVAATERAIISSGVHCFINRIKNRDQRLRFAEFFYRNKIPLINSLPLEHVSVDKTKTKEAFEEYGGINTANSCLIPLYPILNKNVGLKVNDHIDHMLNIAEREVGYPVVIKPSRGSRGGGFVNKVIHSPEEMKSIIQEFSRAQNILRVPKSMCESLSNPIGVFVEEYLPHALDLRCIVSQNSFSQHHACLARIGTTDDSIQKNTSLGNMAVGIEANEELVKISKESLSAILDYAKKLFVDCPKYGITGVDIIPCCEDRDARQLVYKSALELADQWQEVEKAKRNFKTGLSKLWNIKYCGERDHERLLYDPDFEALQKKIYEAFSRFKSHPSYMKLQKAVGDYIEKSTLFVSENNTTVDYEFQTLNLCGPIQNDIAKLALTIGS